VTIRPVAGRIARRLFVQS